RRARDHEGQVMRAGIPHRRMEIADVAILITMRRIRDGRRVDINTWHLIWVGVRKSDRKDVLLAVARLKRGAAIHLTVGRGTKLDERKSVLRLSKLAMNAGHIHEMTSVFAAQIFAHRERFLVAKVGGGEVPDLAD